MFNVKVIRHEIIPNELNIPNVQLGSRPKKSECFNS